MRFFSTFRGLVRCESGTTLLETVVALAVLGLIAVTFLTGLATSSRATFAIDKRATAESLAQSQMEYVQIASYNATGYSATLPAGDDYVNYAASITAESLNNPDDGIQKITVIVTFSGEQIFTLEGYKVQR